MENKRLDVDNIIDLENRVDALEGNDTVNTQPITKPELDNLNDRILVLEGEEPAGPQNPMYINELKGFEGRVEALEDQPTPVTKFTITYDVNGGEGSIDAVEVEEGQSVTLNDGSTITAPEDKTFDGWTTTKDDESTKVSSPYTPSADITLYALYV